MTLASHLSALGPGTTVLLGFVLLLAIAAALFDWNWFRRPLERYVSEKSGREVRIEDLHVKVGLALEPTVRLRGVYVQNAPWASRQPMAVAGEAQFTFSLKSVWEKRPVILRLVLRDADVVLERQENGLRNWRLLNPEYRGPGRIKVLTLEPHRSQIRFINRGIALDLVAAASPLKPGAAAAQNDEVPKVAALLNRIAFKGSYRGAAFSGEALTGGLLSFRESGLSFPLRGYFASGKTRLEIDGSIADMFDLSAMDAKVRVAGPTLSKLHPFVPFRPAASRPFEVEAQVKQRENEYNFARLRAKIGGTKITGEASYTRKTDRPLLRAALQSEAADISDLAPLADVNYRPDETASLSVEAPAAAEGKAGLQRSPRDYPEVDRGRPVVPEQPIHRDRLRAIDAHVTMDARKVRAAEIPVLESLRLTVNLNDGVLELNPVDLGMAGGHVTGSLTFNGRHEPPSSHANIAASNIRLEKLFPSLSAAASSAGPIRAQIRFSGRGNSVATILGNSTGSAAAIMDRGSIANLADAKIALNRVKILGLLIRGDRDIALNCGAMAFDFKNGKGKSQAMLLDTEQTHTEGVGTVDLRAQQFDLLLTPRPKRPAVFALEKSIRVQGSFKKAGFSLVDRVPMDGGGIKGAPPATRALFRTLTEAGEHGGCAEVIASARAADSEGNEKPFTKDAKPRSKSP